MTRFCSSSVAILFILMSFALAQTAKPAPAPADRKTDYTFIVSAKDWTDTGLDLQRGDRVHIYGGVLNCQSPTYEEKQHVPHPSAPAGALLAKLNLEEPPVSASPDADLPILDASHLYLGLNCANHNGTLRATVHVDWRKNR
jgi:hypothetical protein